MLPEQLKTTTTDLLKIKHPIMLAGMNVAAGPRLAAAVTNAGGLGVIGGVGYTPDMLKEQIAELKSFLHDKNAPFGVDLLLPQVGGSARKTKYVFDTVHPCLMLKDGIVWILPSIIMLTSDAIVMIIQKGNWTSLLLSSSKAAQSFSSQLWACHRSMLSTGCTMLVYHT